VRIPLSIGDYAEVVPGRTTLFVGVALLAVPSALVLSAQAGPVGVPAAVAGCSVLAVIAARTVGRAHVHLLAIAAGSASLVVTAYVLLADLAIDTAGRNLGPVELIALCALLAAVARWTTPLRLAVAAGAVVWTAGAVWILRLLSATTESPTPPSASTAWPIESGYDLLVVVGNVAASALLPTAAVVAGGLPRYLAHRRSELVAAVRREQRLELAQDLHDFVAHDLTGIVAQAQAARFARADDVDHLRGALERIEDVGVAALETMDGLVQVLHDGDAAPLSMRRIADVPDLVERFRAERGPGAPVRVDLDDDLPTRVPRPLQATAYRVVIEGLTNVRRHADPECPVTVSLGATADGSLSVAVLNEVGAAPSDRHRRTPGGTGLTALRERVTAVGGHLEAGPDGAGHWRLRATLPNPAEGDPQR
jgi:signal transduction histidine kinase